MKFARSTDVPTTIDPSSGAVLQEHPFFEPDETESRLARAHETFEMWRGRALAERAEHLRALAGVLREGCEAAAELMADEMGKPLGQGRAELQKCAWLCEHFAEHGAAMLAPELIETDARRSYVSHQPLGVILAIMPWNFPWWQALRFAVPALLAGNTVLLKHALNTTGCAFSIEKSLRDAGFPIGCLEALVIDHPAVAELITDDRVVGVTLTGSTRAGRAVGEAAGRSLKKIVLELGGSDPYLVCHDADVELAAEVCVRARLHNSGQTCIAAKRFIVHDAVADEFCERVIDGMRRAVVGHPREAATEVGPLARVDLRDALHDQVQRSLAAGACLRLGGERPEGPGAFYPPTVLSGVRPGMPAADEELFGPVAAIMRVQNEDEAVAVANTSAYGLGAAIFSRDLERAEVIARERLHAGCCFVNDQVRSDPRLPFGGVKHSGHGRELGRTGLLEWVNHKTVWIA
jgi:succinate-semialdehyde dehydrogenase / glutarate-semialdehyde dehydrogenase